MIIAGEYPPDVRDSIREKYPELLQEVEAVIASVDAPSCKTKISKEKTMMGKLLYSPRDLNRSFAQGFKSRGWRANKRVYCDYSTAYYRPEYLPKPMGTQSPYREMDFLKDRLGIEVQFGKYAFLVYNVCAKMTIFHNLDHIDAGIEIVPVKSFTEDMSTGVSIFEQFVWDLEQRGVADIDIPVLILGVDVDTTNDGNGISEESDQIQLNFK